MRYLSKAALAFTCLLFASGCDQALNREPASDKPLSNPIVGDVAHLEADVRLTAANKRIDELERKVETLQSTPEKLDLDLITARVAALEAWQVGATSASQGPVRKALADPIQPPPLALKRLSDVAGQAKHSSSVTLPELESARRLATP
jgi:hypothetical protein